MNFHSDRRDRRPERTMSVAVPQFDEQMNVIGTGLKSLRHWRLMSTGECAEMYEAAQKHFQDARFARISGKPNDLLKKCVKDTQFYCILIRMMMEASLSMGSRQQHDLLKVYNWYLSNKHNLYSAPRFGKFRQQEEGLKKLQETASGLPSHWEKRLSPPAEPEPRPKKTVSVNSRPASKNHKYSYHSNSWLSPKFVLVRSQTRSLTARTPSTPLLRPKMVHPIVSLVNPHAQPRPGPRPVSASQQEEEVAVVSNERELRLNQWEEFKSQIAVGQAALGKLQYCGRTGTPYDVRYAAHGLGENPEYSTRQMIDRYMLEQAVAKYRHVQESVNRAPSDGESYGESDESGEEAPVQVPLEEFYEQAEQQYVPRRDKYPTVNQRLSLAGQDQINSSRDIDSVSGDERIRVDSVVDMIDTVSGDMQYYKQKVAPYPCPGFLQPTVPINDLIGRPRTAPVYGSDYQRKLLHKSKQLSTAPQVITPPQTPTHPRPPSLPIPRVLLDWRGNVEPGTARYKWAEPGFSEHSFAKKTTRAPRAGTAPAGKRPKTAPTPIKDKLHKLQSEDESRPLAAAATHHAKFLTNETVNQMVNVQYLGGTSDEPMPITYIPRSAYAHFFYYDDRPLYSAPPSVEFMNFCGPKNIADNKPEKRLPPQNAHEKASGRGRTAPPRVPPHTPLPPPTTVVEENQSRDQYLNNDWRHQLEEAKAAVAAANSAYDLQLNPCQNESDISINLNELQLDKDVEVEKEESECELEVTESGPDEGEHHLGEEADDKRSEPDNQSVENRESRSASPLGTMIHLSALTSDGKRELLVQTPAPPPEEQSPTDLNLHHHGQYWPDAIVDPGHYCSTCLPESARPKSSLSQSEKKGRGFPPGRVIKERMATPVRSPPSIPSPFHGYGGRSPRQLLAYQAELEHHARLESSPRRFMEKVSRLRTEGPRHARQDEGQLLTSLNVHGRGLDKGPLLATTTHSDRPPSEVSRASGVNQSQTSRRRGRGSASRCRSAHQLKKGASVGSVVTNSPASQSRRSSQPGRPIPDYGHVKDPELVIASVERQKQASAAVDIQRIFRGHMARINLRQMQMLDPTTRYILEDKQKVLNQTKREQREHVSRVSAIARRDSLTARRQWEVQYQQTVGENVKQREREMLDRLNEIGDENKVQADKISTIGPHVYVYQAFNRKQTGATVKEMNTSASTIQKHIRGFLLRRRFSELHKKALKHASSFSAFMREYRALLVRIQRHYGVARPSTPFDIDQVIEFMDLKKQYELVFDRCSFGGELEVSELQTFFKNCDLFPSPLEIDQTYDLIHRDKKRSRSKNLTKKEAMEILFHIYIPPAAGLEGTRVSTWMHPIIDGVEAIRFAGAREMGSTPLRPCIDMVARSMRRQKMDSNDEELERFLNGSS